MTEIQGQVHTCFHCGNTGILKYLGKTRCEDSDIQYDETGEVVDYYLIEHYQELHLLLRGAGKSIQDTGWIPPVLRSTQGSRKSQDRYQDRW